MKIFWLGLKVIYPIDIKEYVVLPNGNSDMKEIKTGNFRRSLDGTDFQTDVDYINFPCFIRC